MSSSNTKKIPLKGTEHPTLPGARAIGPTDLHQLIEISVILKHRKALPPAEEESQILSHNDFAKSFGADPAQLDKIRQFAHENNLQLLERGDELLRRTVTLAGTAAAMEKAFNVELTEFEYDNGCYRGHNSAVQMPEDCASFVTGVFGLDNSPVAQPHIRRRGASQPFGTRASSVSYTPPQVTKLYGFPLDANGNGQTIGLIELGGGYRPADIREYFHALGLQPPTLKSISVDHADNRPTTPQSADCQVALDIEVAGAVAPGAAIAVYFAPNTACGFQDAISTAIHDQLNKPRVLSIGWGNAEITWTKQSMGSFNQLALEAGMLGITITVAAGENADPETGYNILVNGERQVAGGTSAAAPLWAGLIVLLNQKLNQRLGFINPMLYNIDQSSGFRDINLGNNGVFSATFGWDPVTGQGSPMGAQLLQALQGAGASSRGQRKEAGHAVAMR